jgi:hypothetical protein
MARIEGGCGAVTGWLDLQGAAAYTSLSVRTLRRALSDLVYPMPANLVHGKWLMRPEDLDLWIQSFKKWTGHWQPACGRDFTRHAHWRETTMEPARPQEKPSLIHAADDLASFWRYPLGQCFTRGGGSDATDQVDNHRTNGIGTDLQNNGCPTPPRPVSGGFDGPSRAEAQEHCPRCRGASYHGAAVAEAVS